MTNKPENPPAFPSTSNKDFATRQEIPLGMTLRDYFAIKCSEQEIEARIPSTIGEVADELVKRGRITIDSRQRDVMRCYNTSDILWLRSIVRYEFADDMLKARQS